MTDVGEFARLSDDHLIAVLGVHLTLNDGWAAGVAPVRPELFAPGTETIRTGMLATMVDLVAGHAPNGPTGPTVDLRVEVFSPPPASGHVHLVCHPLRVGKRLIVAETLLRSSATSEPFARGLTTFINQPLSNIGEARPFLPMGAATFDEFIGALGRDDGTFEVASIPRISNGLHGTVQGGAQALVAEIAAEHAVAVVSGRPEARSTATDLDIRYLGRLLVGPLLATPTLDPGPADGPRRVSVRLTDGNDDRLIGYVTLRMSAAPHRPA